MKHIKPINSPNLVNFTTPCKECKTSCQSACKTSCTVSNQECESNK
ncbi:MAG: six-cysteine ranthipeptide SCIFF [Clostridia bacterium]